MGVVKKIFGFGILILAVITAVITVVLLSGCVQQEDQQQIETTTSKQTEETKETVAEEEKNTFKLEEISQHNSSQDCWLVIHDKVYNVTNWIPSHPGGKSLLQGCGKDATELFETRPMGSGTKHSQNARNKLNDYYIGDLRGDKMPEKKFFRCTVCNDIHYGVAGPEICPTCQTKNAYVEIDKEEAKNIMEI